MEIQDNNAAAQTLKTSLRTAMRAKRRMITPAQRALAAKNVAQAGMQLVKNHGWQTVGLYAATASEMPTQLLAEALWQAGIQVAFPRVLGAGSALNFYPIQAWGDLAPGFQGILEPKAEAESKSHILDAIFVPGLAFDAQGGRLGYGQGYYDRTLGDFVGVAVGMAFLMQLVQSVPMAAHDRAMDVILKEDGAWIEALRMDKNGDRPKA